MKREDKQKWEQESVQASERAYENKKDHVQKGEMEGGEGERGQRRK